MQRYGIGGLLYKIPRGIFKQLNLFNIEQSAGFWAAGPKPCQTSHNLITFGKNGVMKRILILFVFTVVSVGNGWSQGGNAVVSREEATRLAALPLKCMQKEYPNKLNQTLADSSELAGPRELHPAFYGCFDWHSSVHGHWMLVRLLKIYPDLENAALIREKLAQNITPENMAIEVEYFKRPHEKSWERTYGWAWLLKLAEELDTWDDPLGKRLSSAMEPLTQTIVNLYLDFLPRLNYPVRVGEHPNTAFGLAFAWDYAVVSGHGELKSLIESRARDFFLNDQGCPINWEPGGYDFFSPCLEEADLMRRILPAVEFRAWLEGFLPGLASSTYKLKVARVSDRSDGKLVHLDGLNFSRARCLNGIAGTLSGYDHLRNIAQEHIRFSLPAIVDGGYEGEHWLASFALLAMISAP